MSSDLTPEQRREAAWLPLPDSSPQPVIDHKPNTCRWPVGQSPILFCAEPSGAAIYCPAHTALAHHERKPE